ncbi:carbon-nitrogen hydrolase family protein [Massilia sp. BJB1822]|uniref:carbon-nitrogen hydrolase family protein n=1 Tax=Massilia sp. BJB1822 TaxID=2744470 RepID=UPI0015935340|nr:carbon-nitrogen hydrolase family protein [Massilia sp. BJB1822]NVD98813.1 carbon-nitrogen hydrolase family protein [Massilia sp. BJB1822]
MKISIIAGSLHTNAEQAWQHMRQAVLASPAADFIVLPARFLGEAESSDAALLARVQEGLAELAREKRCYIVGGSLLAADGTQEVTWLFDRHGALAHTQRIPLDPQQRRADQAFPVIETDCGRIGILNGDDIWVLESSRILSLQGAEVLFVPSRLSSRNVESKIASLWGLSTLSCVAIVFAGGPHADGQAHASVILPSGVLAASEQADGAPLLAEIAPGQMAKLRDADLTFANTLWFGLWSRRKQLYGPLLQAAAPAERAHA